MAKLNNKSLDRIYACDHPDCEKRYTRLEHLKRHKLNHNPHTIYRCKIDGCSQWFVREDLLRRHLERHKRREDFPVSSAKGDPVEYFGGKVSVVESDSSSSSSGSSLGSAVSSSSSSAISASPTSLSSHETNSNGRADPKYDRLIKQELQHINGQAISTNMNNGSSANINNLTTTINEPTCHLNHINSASNVSNCNHQMNNINHANGTHLNSIHGLSNQTLASSLSSGGQPSVADTKSYYANPPLSTNYYNMYSTIPYNLNSYPLMPAEHALSAPPIPPQAPPPGLPQQQMAGCCGSMSQSPMAAPYMEDFTSWLFSDAVLSTVESFTPFESPLSLHSLVSPPGQNEQLSDEKKAELLNLIPLSSDVTLFFEQYIETFWTRFHPQYPILHRPSFNASHAEPGLLWAIILVGAASAHEQKAREIADQIAEPLRWILFAHPDFTPPAELWVIQSLLLLEIFEKSMSKRKFHERGHIHHGTLLQLIRRGSALKGEYHHQLSASGDFMDPWQKWIRSESAKRAVLMAFCLDVFDAALFGHSMIMSVHEIRLNLPCDEELWEAYPKDRTKKVPNAEPFLIALKKVLNKEHVNADSFGRRILLSGLLCISLQMQQGDLQASTVGWPAGFRRWKEYLIPALEWWREDSSNSDKQNSKYHRDTPGCLWPFYHVGHVIILLSPLDINIYAGCPATLNHKISKEEREATWLRVREACHSKDGAYAVWHAIQFLKEMYTEALDPASNGGCLVCCSAESAGKTGCHSGQRDEKDSCNGKEGRQGNVKYDAANDPICKRPHMVFVCALFLWVYVFDQGNIESTVLRDIEEERMIISTPMSSSRSARTPTGSPSAKDAGAIPTNEELQRAISADTTIEKVEELLNFYEHREDGHDYLRRMSQYTPDQLETAVGKSNIVGFLRLVMVSLKSHQWDLVIEGRRLLCHCIYRSLGGNQVTCQYMFERRKLN